MKKNTYLIQRLEKPYNVADFGIPQDTKEMRQATKQVFRCDYMGAAEFEFGALGKSVDSIWEEKDSYEMFRSKIGDKTYWGFCRKEDTQEVIATIEKVAANKLKLKEAANFDQTLNPTKEWHGKIIGWLEINNNFFWTVDKNMLKGFLRLFGRCLPGETK